MHFTWSSASLNDDNDDLITQYTVVFTDETGFTNPSDHRTVATNLTATLEFNKTYSVMVDASRCDGALTSDPVITKITIDKGTKEWFCKVYLIFDYSRPHMCHSHCPPWCGHQHRGGRLPAVLPVCGGSSA